MKLTEDKLKKLILEEIKNLDELVSEDPNNAQADKEGNPGGDEEGQMSAAALKKQLYGLSMEVQNMGLKSIQATLISRLLNVIVKLSTAEGGNVVLLKKVLRVLSDKAGA